MQNRNSKNFILGKIGELFLSNKITIDMLLAKLFAPICTAIGINPEDASVSGTILGQKIVLNEFIAYAKMVKSQMAERSTAILTYAVCGMANFSVIGIMIGGVGALSKEQKPVLIELGLRALLGATLVNLLNAAIASLLI